MTKKLARLCALTLAVLLCAALCASTAFADVPSLPDTATNRVLNLYKYAPSTPVAGAANDGTQQNVPNSHEPLANVSFEIWKVTLTPAGQTPSASEITTVTGTAGNLEATVQTNAAGLATYNFGTAKDGTYLIREVANPAVEVAADPFYLSVPMTNPTEDGFIYNMFVYPKNTLKPGPTVSKDVNVVDDRQQGYSIGDIIPFIIRGTVPDDLYNDNGTGATGDDVYAETYQLVDALPAALTYKGNISVKLFTQAGTETAALAANCFSTAGTSAAGTKAGTVTVDLTEAGMKYIADNLGTGASTPEIRVYFDACINSDAVVGNDIANTATLNYTNSTGHTYEPVVTPEDKRPVVYTGGLMIKKTDGKDNTITDGTASFKIATSEANATAGNFLKKNAAGEFVDFGQEGYAAATDFEVSTAAGIAQISGLGYQKDSTDPTGGKYYWLVETKAPDGFNLLTAPQRVIVNATSHTDAGQVTVVNTDKFTLPRTGGSGTFIFTMSGVALIGIAALILAVYRRKKRAAQ